MPTGTILAHKHTLVEAYAGFFRALATESFAAVRHWLHPELERLISQQCHRTGEVAFLRNLRHGLGSASQRLRLGSSQAEGAGQIRSQLINDAGEQAGSVRFVLSGDGWRIYAVEVWTAPKPAAPVSQPVAVRRAQPLPMTKLKETKLSRNTLGGVPKMLAATRWLTRTSLSD